MTGQGGLQGAQACANTLASSTLPPILGKAKGIPTGVFLLSPPIFPPPSDWILQPVPPLAAVITTALWVSAILLPLLKRFQNLGERCCQKLEQEEAVFKSTGVCRMPGLQESCSCLLVTGWTFTMSPVPPANSQEAKPWLLGSWADA